jgi:hypothetical protein
MPPQDKKGPSKKELRDWLKGFGLQGDYLALIDAAVRHDWGTGQFISRLVDTRAFRHQFPGLIERNGSLANFLVSGKEGQPVGISSLGQAISNYRTFEGQFEKVARNYGFNWNKNMMLNVIRDQTSPQEFTQRLATVWTVDNTPGLHDFFEKALKQFGIKGVNTQKELYRLAGGVSTRRFEDIYETSRLMAGGLGFQGPQAKKLAQGLGQPGETVDLDKLISDVRQNLSYIGPELATQGVTNADLLKFLNNPEANPDLAGKINSVVAARKSMGAPQDRGMQLQRGPAGGPTQYAPEGAAAY